MGNFYIVDLENFATASRRITGDIHNTSVIGLFMTPIGQWKRLDRVMVECTCLLYIGHRQLPRSSAETTSTTSPEEIEVMKLVTVGRCIINMYTQP